MHEHAMMRHICTDQVRRWSKTAVQWPDLGAQRCLTSLRPRDLLNAITYLKCNILKEDAKTCDVASYKH